MVHFSSDTIPPHDLDTVRGNISIQYSQREPIRDPDEAGVVSLDVVHLRDLRRRVSEQVRHLFRREAEERPVRLLDSVYKFRAKSVPEGVQTFLLDPGVLQDLVIPLAEVDRAGVLPLLIAHERRVLAEVEFLPQILDRFDGGVVEGNVPLARRALELADLDLAPAVDLRTVAAVDFLYAALDVDHAVVQIDVAVEQTEQLSRAQSGV